MYLVRSGSSVGSLSLVGCLFLRGFVDDISGDGIDGSDSANRGKPAKAKGADNL